MHSNVYLGRYIVGYLVGNLSFTAVMTLRLRGRKAEPQGTVMCPASRHRGA